MRISVYKDMDHTYDNLIKRPVTRIILFINNTSLKMQKKVENSTHRSQLVAAK